MFSVKINTKGLDRVLDELGRDVDRVSRAALEQLADMVLVESNKLVPMDEGTLADSGVVKPRGNEVDVGYHTPYAARLHEHPEYNFRKDRNPRAQGKYLETPIKTKLSKWLKIYGQGMKKLI